MSIFNTQFGQRANRTARRAGAVSSPRIKPLAMALWLLVPGFAAAAETAYEFDNSMLVGAAKTQNVIERFNKENSIEPGNYQVDLWLNGVFINRQSVQFRENNAGTLSACFPYAMLTEMNILPDHIRTQGNAVQCLHLEEQVDGAASNFDFARQRLDLLVPQIAMKRQPRGAVASQDLTAGNTMMFVNYDSNYYRTHASGMNSESTYVGLNSGINLGLWQLRQQSSLTRNSSDIGPSTTSWKLVRSWLQRPLPLFNSQMLLGDNYTSGNQFSSIGFRGIQIATDDRMLPESQRGYAPVVRGMATTTAKVTVRQGGNEIYQTTVPPGAFAIDDLYPTSYQGDLVVEVQEADGKVSSFIVPFSAVPDSMRAGHSRWNLSAGKVNDISDSNATFADLTWQRGLSNAITANTGVRISDGYQALLLGTVYASEYGALGLNAVYSRADLWGDTLDGWRVGANWSRTFQPTATTLTLAGYRYSTQGYRDLNDVLGLRTAHDRDAFWSSRTYQQNDQFVVSISQGLGEYGQVYLSGSTSTYRGDRGRDTQYQMAWSNNYGSLNYSLSLSRQQAGYQRYGLHNDESTLKGRTENLAMLSFSMPLGSGSRGPVLTSGISQTSGSQKNTSYQTSMTGALGDSQKFSYSLNGTHDSNGTGTSVGANVNQQLSAATVGASLSHGKNYTQGGLSARGALVAHSGGITAGPYVGETFALVQAEGAEGAEVINGMGAKIDRFGYAVVPSMVPYRYNDISIDAQGMQNMATELTENQQRVAPHAGAAVKVKFRTLEGYPLLLKLSGQPLPLGINVFDSSNTSVGIVGQSNQIYARVTDKKGKLYLKGDDSNAPLCTINYDISHAQPNQVLYRLDLPCI